MTREDTKQAILGFTEFFKGITGNQDLKIPDDIAKEYGIEQAPCEDAISRQAVLDTLDAYEAAELSNHVSAVLRNEIKSLPSVKPNYTDAEIQKMQDLEFAEIQKAYEIGKDEGSSEWIPVSEPPKTSGRYLVSMCYVTHDAVGTASYSTDLHKVDEYDFPKHEAGWYNYDSEYGYYKIENVIVAYMPLPKPYVPDTNVGDKAESEG